MLELSTKLTTLPPARCCEYNPDAFIQLLQSFVYEDQMNPLFPLIVSQEIIDWYLITGEYYILIVIFAGCQLLYELIEGNICSSGLTCGLFGVL